MDRREALKKLAAGGVVAAGAPIVLSSFDVAAAASPPGTGLQGVPGSGEPILVNHQVNSSTDTIALSIATAPTCSSGTLTTTYEWMIIQYTVQAQRRLQIRNSTNTSTLVAGAVDTTCSGGCGTTYSTPSTATGAVTLRTVQQGDDARPRALAAGNRWVVQVRITWQCSGHSAVQAEYRIDGTYPNTPTVTNQSYTIL
jgi:hypothetical protein